MKRNNTLTTVLAKTETDYWHVNTSGESGNLGSSLCHGTRKAGDDSGFWSYRMQLGTGNPATEGYHTLIRRKVPRCTARIIAEAHAEAEVLGRALYARLTQPIEAAP